MAITGQESALKSALTAAITAAIQTKLGSSVQSPQYIDALSEGIANALIPFLTSNVTVNPIAAGALTSPVGPVTGNTAPGTIS